MSRGKVYKYQNFITKMQGISIFLNNPIPSLSTRGPPPVPETRHLRCHQLVAHGAGFCLGKCFSSLFNPKFITTLDYFQPFLNIWLILLGILIKDE